MHTRLQESAHTPGIRWGWGFEMWSNSTERYNVHVMYSRHPWMKTKDCWIIFASTNSWTIRDQLKLNFTILSMYLYIKHVPAYQACTCILKGKFKSSARSCSSCFPSVFTVRRCRCLRERFAYILSLQQSSKLSTYKFVPHLVKCIKQLAHAKSSLSRVQLYH